jgi:hypothetical protein
VESVDDSGCKGHRDIAASLRQSFLPRIGEEDAENPSYSRVEWVSTAHREDLDRASNEKSEITRTSRSFYFYAAVTIE